MIPSNSAENDFITKLTEIAESNLTNPKFGVSMLARELGMSRSNLHRKVYSYAKLSVSQFINHLRLKKAKDLLRNTSFTVSEIAYQVGFNNVSYFIKCFHKYFGYTPGDIENRNSIENDSNFPEQTNKRRLIIILSSVVFMIILSVVLLLVFKPFSDIQTKQKKTIAVLRPEINGDDPIPIISNILWKL